MKTVIRLMILVAIGLAVVPVDPDKRAVFLKSANERVGHVLSTCQREPDLCRKTADDWQAFTTTAHEALVQTFMLAKSALSAPDSETARLAADLGTTASAPAPDTQAPTPPTAPIDATPLADIAVSQGTLSASDRGTVWQSQGPAIR